MWNPHKLPPCYCKTGMWVILGHISVLKSFTWQCDRHSLSLTGAICLSLSPRLAFPLYGFKGLWYCLVIFTLSGSTILGNMSKTICLKKSMGSSSGSEFSTSSPSELYLSSGYFTKSLSLFLYSTILISWSGQMWTGLVSLTGSITARNRLFG